MDKKPDRRGLGRGLSALMADINLGPEATPDSGPRQADILVPVSDIEPNPDQPRKEFDSAALKDLADSIRQKGVIQPLIVRRKSSGRPYEIVAGERRWRAAQLAHLHEVPVIIREFTDAEVLEIAIIENIQREELNAIDEALAYRQLMDRFGHTQEKIAEALSRSRSHVANLLRLLSLPEDVRSMVSSGTLSAGHARALINTPDPVQLALRVVGKGLSVRETEALVRKAGMPKPKGPAKRPEKDADTRSLEGDLSAGLGMPVSIDHELASERGRVTITYSTLEELDALCRLLAQFERQSGSGF